MESRWKIWMERPCEKKKIIENQYPMNVQMHKRYKILFFIQKINKYLSIYDVPNFTSITLSHSFSLIFSALSNAAFNLLFSANNRSICSPVVPAFPTTACCLPPSLESGARGGSRRSERREAGYDVDVDGRRRTVGSWDSCGERSLSRSRGLISMMGISSLFAPTLPTRSAGRKSVLRCVTGPACGERVRRC